MAEKVLPPSELFHYSAAHKVLICTVCRYAIQPAAIARHLKEIHHIYRGARRPYAAYVETLELKKPENVEAPILPGQFPVAQLPVEQGWHCAAPGCSYMCVSTKRMETHWPVAHGRKGIEARDWTPCLLQTFFRGNMLRYFTGQPTGNRSINTSCRLSAALQDDCSEVHASAASWYIPRLQQRYHFDSLDNLILKHYFSSTYKNFMLPNDASLPIWLETVPGIAADHPFLMHGMLACTSLHMAHLDPPRGETYTLRACVHQEAAIPLFRYAIEHPSEQNCDALVTFGYLLIVCSFANDVNNNNNPLFLLDNSGSEWRGKRLILPQWLHFIRAGCSMLCDVWDEIEKGPVRILADVWEVEPIIGDGKLPYLDYFLSIIPQDSSWPAESISTYCNAATALAESFAHLENIRDESDFTTWQILGVWPLRIEDAYMVLLADRHPGALILLAYFCVILKRIDELWYFKGRSARLLGSILHVLDERWHPYIKKAAHQVLS